MVNTKAKNQMKTTRFQYSFKDEEASGQTNYAPNEHARKAIAVCLACFIKKSAMG